ncbi:MAG: HAD-IB family phosphatase [Anaerolineae bacterium]|nr:HAD-IB family phosphatase [Anaerolineae bacterium]
MEIVATDLDGTISAGHVWQALREYLIQHGHEAAFKRFNRKYIPEYVLVKLGLRDETAFKEKWLLGMLRLYEGFTEAEFAEVAEWVIGQEVWPNRRKPVVDELMAHQANGRSVIIVTGVFQPVLDNLAARLGFEAIGTGLVFENGRFTGEATGPLNVGKQKVITLRQRFGEDVSLFAAYGDTGPDEFMLEMSQFPVAVSPDPKLRQVAEARGWRILE